MAASKPSRDYSGMLGLAEHGRPLWIFSLNHDLLAEAIADASSVPVYTGVAFHVRTKDDLEKHGLHHCNRNEPAINLFKLHGSLDEFAFNDGNDLLKLVPDRGGLVPRVNSLRLVKERIHQPFKATNEIAYLDDDGETQFLRPHSSRRRVQVRRAATDTSSRRSSWTISGRCSTTWRPCT